MIAVSEYLYIYILTALLHYIMQHYVINPGRSYSRTYVEPVLYLYKIIALSCTSLQVLS